MHAHTYTMYVQTHTHLQWWESVVSEKLAFHLTPEWVVQPQQSGLQWSEAHRGKDIMEIATLVIQCEGVT